MIWNNVELFNAEHIETATDGKIYLRRFPKSVMNTMGTEDNKIYGKYVSRMTTGCEIRFCGESAAVTLSAWEADGIIEVYRGEYFHSRHRLLKGQANTILLTEGGSIDTFNPKQSGRFSNQVWRIVFSHDFCGVLHNIDPLCEIRPPYTKELPLKRMLAYGSSITHGAGSTTFSHAYISVAARRLGVDVLNKGMGGSCMCEWEIADYFIKEDWDFAVLELGVNMLGIVPTDCFKLRAENFIKKVLEADKEIFMISPFPSYNDIPEATFYNQLMEYRAVLNEIYNRLKSPKLIYINGENVLNDFSGLLCDLIHPSDYGHSVMGNNLSELIGGVI